MTIHRFFFVVTLLFSPTKIGARHHLRGLVRQYDLQETTSVFETAYTEHGNDNDKEDLGIHVEHNIGQIRHSDGPSVVTINENAGNTSDGARYIVKFKEDSSDYMIRMQNANVVNNNDAYSTFGHTTRAEFGNFIPKDKVEIMNIKPNKVREWEERQDVEYIELDSKVYLQKEEIPYGIEKVKAFSVSDKDISNRKVCIIDTGYDMTNPDLPSDPNVVTGNTGRNSGDAWNKDTNGHGTHVAGILAAMGGNKKGVVGISRNGQLKLHIVRVFGDDNAWTWKSTLIAAVEDCVDAGANIVNMSIGGPIYSKFEEDTFSRIVNKDNVLLVAAAGNDGNTEYTYPASYSSVMSVAAVRSNNQLASFSQRNDQVDIAAPGVNILSTGISRRYTYNSGTSFAAPHVSGVAALIWSSDTNKSAKEIREALEQSAQDLGPKGRDDSFGYGLVRADLAMKYLDKAFQTPPSPSPTKLTCKNVSNEWTDSRGKDCSWYNDQGYRCLFSGSSFRNNNLVANEVCCACGGGVHTPATPTDPPTRSPTKSPTRPPTMSPAKSPTKSPTRPPTMSPTKSPTKSPTRPPTMSPTKSPTNSPTMSPTMSPTKSSTNSPTKSPILIPSRSPTSTPSDSLTTSITSSERTTITPSLSPTTNPLTKIPTSNSTETTTPSPSRTVLLSPTIYPSSPPTQSSSMPSMLNKPSLNTIAPSKTPPILDRSRSPTSTTSSSNCSDYPSGWADKDGYGCDWYAAESSRCDLYGNSFMNMGRTAHSTCCACGGGLRTDLEVNAGYQPPSTNKNLPSTPSTTNKSSSAPTSAPTHKRSSSPTDRPTCKTFMTPTNPPTSKSSPTPTNLPTLHISPSPTSSPTTPSPICVDAPLDWKGSLSSTISCELYKSNPNYCAWYGKFKDNYGTPATQACCICGGGTTLSV